MRAEQAIANWRDWQTKPLCKPEMIAPIGGGLSNLSYLLSTGESQLVLRMNAKEGELPGIDREREAKIWRAASLAGITPRLLHAEPAYFVSEFVAGGSVANAPPDEALTDQAICLIHQCHALEINVPELNYAAHIQRYWDLIEINGLPVDEMLTQQKLTMQHELETLSLTQTASVLCHHDPVKANFLGSAQRLLLIDWEYAAKGMAVMDYAAFAVEWEVDEWAIFKASGIQPQVLNQAKRLYRYMCQLWAVAQRSIAAR